MLLTTSNSNSSITITKGWDSDPNFSKWEPQAQTKEPIISHLEDQNPQFKGEGEEFDLDGKNQELKMTCYPPYREKEEEILDQTNSFQSAHEVRDKCPRTVAKALGPTVPNANIHSSYGEIGAPATNDGPPVVSVVTPEKEDGEEMPPQMISSTCSSIPPPAVPASIYVDHPREVSGNKDNLGLQHDIVHQNESAAVNEESGVNEDNVSGHTDDVYKNGDNHNRNNTFSSEDESAGISYNENIVRENSSDADGLCLFQKEASSGKEKSDTKSTKHFGMNESHDSNHDNNNDPSNEKWKDVILGNHGSARSSTTSGTPMDSSNQVTSTDRLSENQERDPEQSTNQNKNNNDCMVHTNKNSNNHEDQEGGDSLASQSMADNTRLDPARSAVISSVPETLTVTPVSTCESRTANTDMKDKNKNNDAMKGQTYCNATSNRDPPQPTRKRGVIIAVEPTKESVRDSVSTVTSSSSSLPSSSGCGGGVAPPYRSILKRTENWQDTEDDCSSNSSHESFWIGNRKSPSLVSFNTVEVRHYSMELGDNPSCSTGAPVSLSWDYFTVEGEEIQPIDEYEAARNNIRRRRRKRNGRLPMNYFDYCDFPTTGTASCKLLNDKKRQEILLKAGYTEEELALADQERRRIRRQRNETKLFLPLSKVEEVWEAGTKKIKRIFRRRGHNHFPPRVNNSNHKLMGGQVDHGSDDSTRSSHGSDVGNGPDKCRRPSTSSSNCCSDNSSRGSCCGGGQTQMEGSAPKPKHNSSCSTDNHHHHRRRRVPGLSSKNREKVKVQQNPSKHSIDATNNF